MALGFIGHLPLEHLTSLKEFTITGIKFTPIMRMASHRSLQWVTPILQTVRVNSPLEVLRFRIWHHNKSNDQTFDWDAMKAILIGMPCLRVVEFEISGGDSLEANDPRKKQGN